MAHSPRVPKYRRHSSGQARVTIKGSDHLLGPYGSASSKEAYRRIIAEWLTRSPVIGATANGETETMSISALILGYWKFAVKHYGFDTNSRRGDYYCLRDALKILRSLYGRTRAEEFGPLALKACRHKMIEMDWSRKYINAQVDRIRRIFRWAAEEELLSASVH